MKEQTFVDLINILQEYHDKSVRFGKAVSDAWIEAGGERDFASPYAYEFLHGGMIDEMVRAISKDFEIDGYPANKAEDLINWWIWECDFGRERYFDFHDANDPTEEMMAVREIDGKVFHIDTPTALYAAILYDQDESTGL